MFKYAKRWIAIGAFTLALPVAASAQQAFARGAVNLRAGPSANYPLVAQLGPGQPVEVMGCTNGYGWCDVVLPDGLRGWVYAQSLDYAYEDRRVPLATYGALIGVPIVSFVIGSYWSDYYRDRPWYGDRRWWRGGPPPPAAGWHPPPPARPEWRPQPFRPGPGFAPQPGYRPQQRPPAVQQPHENIMRPQFAPGREMRQPRAAPEMRPQQRAPEVQPARPSPQVRQPPAAQMRSQQPGGRPAAGGPPPGAARPQGGGGRPGGGGGRPQEAGGGAPGGEPPPNIMAPRR